MVSIWNVLSSCSNKLYLSRGVQVDEEENLRRPCPGAKSLSGKFLVCPALKSYPGTERSTVANAYFNMHRGHCGYLLGQACFQMALLLPEKQLNRLMSTGFPFGILRTASTNADGLSGICFDLGDSVQNKMSTLKTG